MIGETPGPGLAVMMLAVAAAAVVQQVSRSLHIVCPCHSPVAIHAAQVLCQCRTRCPALPFALYFIHRNNVTVSKFIRLRRSLGSDHR